MRRNLNGLLWDKRSSYMPGSWTRNLLATAVLEASPVSGCQDLSWKGQSGKEGHVNSPLCRSDAELIPSVWLGVSR